MSIETARALSGRAIDAIEGLLESRSPRIRFEAARTVLAYAWGTPRQTLELVGGSAELARELATALQEARARRTALAATVPGAAALAAPGVSDDVPVLDAELVESEPIAEAPRQVPPEFVW